MSSIHMLLNFPVVCSANYWDLKVLNQFLHIIFLCKGKGYRVSVLRFSRLAVLVRLCVSFHRNPFPIPLIIYSLGMYILMYRIHVLMPALLPLPTADMFSPCICEKQVLENNISEKHWWLFSSHGLLHQEQLALCRGHQLDTYKLTGDLFWASLLQKQNENSQGACVYLQINRPLSRQYFSVLVTGVNVLRFAKLLWLGIVFYMAFSTLEKIITSTHLTGMLGWQSNVTANFTQAHALARLYLLLWKALVIFLFDPSRTQVKLRESLLPKIKAQSMQRTGSAFQAPLVNHSLHHPTSVALESFVAPEASLQLLFGRGLGFLIPPFGTGVYHTASWWSSLQAKCVSCWKSFPAIVFKCPRELSWIWLQGICTNRDKHRRCAQNSDCEV